MDTPQPMPVATRARKAAVSTIRARLFGEGVIFFFFLKSSIRRFCAINKPTSRPDNNSTKGVSAILANLPLHYGPRPNTCRKNTRHYVTSP